jgi:hypothetical protein
MLNQVRHTAKQNQTTTQSRWAAVRAFNNVFDRYQTQFSLLLLLAALAILYFCSSQFGLEVAGKALCIIGLYVILFSTTISVAGKREIPFGAGIEQPPEVKPARSLGLLPVVLCAAVSEHMRILFDMPALPAKRIATTTANNRFIQPAPPTRSGIATTLTARLISAIPPALPRV